MDEQIFNWDENTTEETAVFEALGAASVCWDSNRVFDDVRAKKIGDELIAFLHR